MRRRLAWLSLAAAVAAVTVTIALWTGRQDVAVPRPVVVPELSLVHPVYRPAHHGGVAFTLAVQRGVRAHHWRFGDMPAQPEVPEDEIAAITRYVRELQIANGIELPAGWRRGGSGARPASPAP